MFFPEKITAIKPGDRVLEIGPGGLPHPRSDVFLELELPKEEMAAQRGYASEFSTDKQIVFYNGGRFPFKDSEFDYVICSHVIEHVDDVKLFSSEIMRVARGGYIEYPTIYYEYLYDFPVHVNILKNTNGKVFFMKKEKSGMSKFSAVQKFFYRSLEQGHSQLVESLSPYMFEGFEWKNSFNAVETASINDLLWKDIDIPVREPTSGVGAKAALKIIINRVRRSPRIRR